MDTAGSPSSVDQDQRLDLDDKLRLGPRRCWLGRTARLDLVLDDFLAEQPLRFAVLVLQSSMFGGGHHFLAGPRAASPPPGIQTPPGEPLAAWPPTGEP